MLKVISTVLFVSVLGACASHPAYYDELRQAENEQHRMIGN